MNRLVISALILLLGLSVSLHADEVDIKKLPGYMDIEKIEIPDGAEDVTEVTIGPELLKATLGSLENEDSDMLELLAGILSIRVRAFDLKSNQMKGVRSIVEDIEKTLDKKEWTRIVRAKSPDELTNISVRFDEGNMVGLLVMSVEEDEAAFINIVGDLNLGKILASLGDGMDFSALDSLQEALKEHQGEQPGS